MSHVIFPVLWLAEGRQECVDEQEWSERSERDIWPLSLAENEKYEKCLWSFDGENLMCAFLTL